MILGGAALVTGLIIGGDAGTVIAVGGAIIGLYGLYVYLGRPTGMEHNDRIGWGISWQPRSSSYHRLPAPLLAQPVRAPGRMG
jgi:hypothetical protein